MADEKGGILDRLGFGNVFKSEVRGEDDLQKELEEFERRQAEERQAFLDSRQKWTQEEVAAWKSIVSLCNSKDDMGIKMLVYMMVREIKLLERKNKDLEARNKQLVKDKSIVEE